MAGVPETPDLDWCRSLAVGQRDLSAPGVVDIVLRLVLPGFRREHELGLDGSRIRKCPLVQSLYPHDPRVW